MNSFNNNKDWYNINNSTFYEELDIHKNNIKNNDILYIYSKSKHGNIFCCKLLENGNKHIKYQSLFDKTNEIEYYKKSIPKKLLYFNVYKKRYIIEHIANMLKRYEIVSLYKKINYCAMYRVFFDDNLVNLIVEYLL